MDIRTIVFIDGQNLYHLARRAWASGPKSPYGWPSSDVDKLAQALGLQGIWANPRRDPVLHRGASPIHGWFRGLARVLVEQESGISRAEGFTSTGGRVNSGGQEKGVDVSLALDLVQATHDQRYEAAIIVSQDSDFGPAVRLAKQIAEGAGEVACI